VASGGLSWRTILVDAISTLVSGVVATNQGATKMAEALLKKREAAERLRVSVRTIDRLRAREELRFVTVGRQVRFRERDISAFIDSQTASAAG